jgi:hypothetical protein
MTVVKALYSLAVVVGLAVAFSYANSSSEPPASTVAVDAPQFKVDPFWPKPLPNDWLLGEVSGIAVDSHDVIWIINRPRSLSEDETGLVQQPPLSQCCRPAPPVIAFDAEGNVVAHWGGPSRDYDWPVSEHGIFVDYKDNVWIAGNGPDDHQVLKFTRDGKFLMQIGEAGETSGSNHTSHLGRPADMEVDPETDEVYIADGYKNKRVIVFDADTGAYKRHWGAYGEKPSDEDLGPYDPGAPAAKQFRNPVHAVRIANDGTVYVADRVNNRIQVFLKNGKFLKEVFIEKKTLGAGSVWDVELSRDTAQSVLYSADGANQKVWFLSRAELSVLGSVGRRGRYAGQFHWVHNVASDSNGNLYTAEVNQGRRTQKFVLQ